MHNRVLYLCFILILITGVPLRSQNKLASDTTTTDKVSILKRIYQYFEESNEEKDDKHFDFSIIGGPHYSSDTKLGLGLVASGLYRLDRSDKSISPSNVSLYGDITTTGAYVIGISGNTIFPKMKYRIDADMYLSYCPSKYWGIGYNNGRNDYYSEYDNLQIEVKVDFLKKIAQGLYVGVTGNVRNAQGKSFEDITLLEGRDPESTVAGMGLILSYDSRDFIPNPYKGIYAKVEHIIYPKFLSTTPGSDKTEVIFRYYQQAWKGAVIALDMQGIISSNNTAWNMLAQAGSSHQMRGYFAGQYRDRNLLQSQVELRQRVYRRNGVVIWAGAGNVFPKFKDFKWDQTLPTFGFGYRWEFKNRVNVRLDYGIGKGQSAFYFNINEAF